LILAMANSFVNEGWAHGPPDPEPEKKTVADFPQWPRWMYRYAEGDPGYEGKVFDKPEDIPEGEGWVENYGKVEKPKPKPFTKKKAGPAVSEDDGA
jgi:hypothetical protein